MQIACLRCNAGLEKYSITNVTFQPYGMGHSHAMLECPGCGHVEFLATTSVVLSALEMIPSFAGDGD
jgi:hypothetical protein